MRLRRPARRLAGGLSGGVAITLSVSLLLLAACGASSRTRCRNIAVEPTGHLARDLVGVWDGFGEDGRLLYDLASDGGFRMIEPPNIWAPGGMLVVGDYSLDDDELRLRFDGGGEARWRIELSAAELELLEKADGSGPLGTFRRVECSGFGFEH